MRKGLQKGFTLVEVLVAAGVLVSLTTGLLATTWAMVDFARDEAEQMMADNLAHDLMRAVYSQKYENIVVGEEKLVFNPETSLPWIVSTSPFGGVSEPVCPLWRDQEERHRPYATIEIASTASEPHEKTIKVTVYWLASSRLNLEANPGVHHVKRVDGEWWKFHEPLVQVRTRFGDGS